MKTLFVILLILLVSCAAMQEPTVSCPPCAAKLTSAQLVKLSTEQAQLAKTSKDLRQKAAYAGQGFGYAQYCVDKDPQNAGCYYYRAVNRELWVGTSFRTAPEQLKKITDDYQMAQNLDSAYLDRHEKK